MPIFAVRVMVKARWLLWIADVVSLLDTDNRKTDKDFTRKECTC